MRNLGKRTRRKNRTKNRRTYRGGSKYESIDKALGEMPGSRDFDGAIHWLKREENDDEIDEIIVKVQTCKRLTTEIRQKLNELMERYAPSDADLEEE